MHKRLPQTQIRACRQPFSGIITGESSGVRCLPRIFSAFRFKPCFRIFPIPVSNFLQFVLQSVFKEIIRTKDNSMKTIGFIGLGLIGGSLAKTIRRTHPEIRLIAWDPEETALKQAFSEGTVQKTCPGITEDFAACDCIFLCTAASDAEELLPQIKAVMRPDALITDTCSVRSGIHEKAEEAGLSGCFIGGHPMAGSGETGYAASTDRLFENAWYVLTPGGDVPVRRVSDFSEFISSIGALPAVMSCEEHDYMTAAAEDLPYLLSASRINMLGALGGPGSSPGIAAGSPADMKELSVSDPERWADRLLANSDNICEILDAFNRKLTDFRFVIRNGDRKKLLQYLTDCRSFAERCCHTKDTEG